MGTSMRFARRAGCGCQAAPHHSTGSRHVAAFAVGWTTLVYTVWSDERLATGNQEPVQE